ELHLLTARYCIWLRIRNCVSCCVEVYDVRNPNCRNCRKSSRMVVAGIELGVTIADCKIHRSSIVVVSPNHDCRDSVIVEYIPVNHQLHLLGRSLWSIASYAHEQPRWLAWGWNAVRV